MPSGWFVPSVISGLLVQGLHCPEKLLHTKLPCIRKGERLQRSHALVVGSSSCVSRHEHFICLNWRHGLLCLPR